MPRLTRLRSAPEGFGLIETIVAAAIIATILLGVSQVAQLALRSSDEASLKLSAGFLAEEGVEVMRLLRDMSWSSAIAPLAPCVDHYPVFSANAWQIAPTPPPPSDGIFTRRMRLEAVLRSASSDISATRCTLSGSDPNIRKVSVEVMWSDHGRTASTTIRTYLTNFFNN